MEFLLAGFFVVALAFLLLWATASRPTDDREALVGSDDGPLALRISGEVGTLVRHEELVHDGTPHRNPVVERREVWKWWPIPGFVEWETRWYPLTIGSRGDIYNLDRIRARVNEFYRRGHDVTIAPMPRSVTIQAERVEDNTQRGRGKNRVARGLR